MAGKSNSFETSLLAHVFTNGAVAGVGDATGLRGSSAAGSLYLSLHTADPGEAGTQTTSECAYTGYGRVAVARSGAGFTVSGSAVSLAANADFGKNTGAGTETALFWGVGTDSSGAGTLLYSGALGASMGVFTATSADVVTCPGVSFSVNDRVTFYPLEGGSLPTGVTEGTVYHVKTVSGNDITVSTSQGGATLDITAAGAGLAHLVTPLTISTNSIPRIEAGSLIREG